MAENSGGNVDYYLCTVTNPKRLKAYVAECEDIIETLNMSFAEGNSFKAIWRKAAARTLGLEKAGNTSLRDAEKVSYYGGRMVVIEKRLLSVCDDS